MSSPPEPIAPRARPLLWATWLIVLFTLAWLVVSAGPALAREMGLTSVRVVHRDFDAGRPAGRAGSDAVQDFERDIGRSVDRLDPGNDEEPFEIVMTIKEANLRERPSASARSIATLKPGRILAVIGRSGAWVQVVHSRPDDTLDVGWIAASDVGAR